MKIQDQIISVLTSNPGLSSREIHERLSSDSSYSTTKRALAKLIDKKLVDRFGNRKNSTYRLGKSYQILHIIDSEAYFEKDIDDREIRETFNFALIQEELLAVELFTDEERKRLEELQATYSRSAAQLSKEEYDKEIERLAIDLSWKSSQIEGNTYTLLETERLLKEKKTALGKHKDEAVMLLNHKEAIDFVVANPDYLQKLSVRAIEDVHSILTKELGISRNLRNRRVGITGTNYRPLDNQFQIIEAFESMCELINRKPSVFDKSLLALVLISYIQGFVDGNKRTARIVSNAILIANNHCPLSFRTVDSIDYKKAMLIFYEQNNITAFKRIFMDQFRFAVRTYF
jgi:Fic family protein